MSQNTMLAPLLCWALLTSSIACNEDAPAPTTKTSRVSAAQNPEGPFLLLSQVQFVLKADANGTPRPQPGPAKLLQLRPSGTSWQATFLEDPESRVFHKATCLGEGSDRRLLTIGATDAHLKTWQWQEERWEGRSHWSPSFGGSWDRLRDYEFGDVDHDGVDELILATHDQGVVAVAEVSGDAFHPKEIYRQKDTFIHEIEVGDINGDQRLEFFATPSAPNSAKASQGGGVLMFRHTPEGYASEQVIQFPTRHAKEILVTDIEGDGVDELYVSLEAESKRSDGALKVTQPLEIYQLKWTPAGKWSQRVVATLPGGVQARVMLAGDLRGIGKKSLIVTTMRDGVWELSPTGKAGPWAQHRIDDNSSGFEHAAGLADMDGDGAEELYVAADDQDELRVHRWREGRYQSEVIYTLPKRDLTWTIEACY